jgi:hypothetical protein
LAAGLMGMGVEDRLIAVSFTMISTHCQSDDIVILSGFNLIEVLRSHRIVDPCGKRDKDHIAGPFEQ